MQLWNIPEQRESFSSRSAELINKYIKGNEKYLINPRTYSQIHTPSLIQGGGGGVFDMLQYFETILLLAESF